MTEMMATETLDRWLSAEKLQAAELLLEQAKARLAVARAEYEALRAKAEYEKLEREGRSE